MKWAFRLEPYEVKKIEKAMNLVESKIKKGGEASVDEVGNAMRSYARMVAPKDTKRLMRLIKYYKAKKGKLEGELVSVNPTKNPPQGYRGKSKDKNFNLALWFAGSPRAVKHAKRGYAKYMDMAVKYGDKIFAGIVDRELKKKLK